MHVNGSNDSDDEYATCLPNADATIELGSFARQIGQSPQQENRETQVQTERVLT